MVYRYFQELAITKTGQTLEDNISTERKPRLIKSKWSQMIELNPKKKFQFLSTERKPHFKNYGSIFIEEKMDLTSY